MVLTTLCLETKQSGSSLNLPFLLREHSSILGGNSASSPETKLVIEKRKTGSTCCSLWWEIFLLNDRRSMFWKQNLPADKYFPVFRFFFKISLQVHLVIANCNSLEINFLLNSESHWPSARFLKNFFDYRTHRVVFYSSAKQYSMAWQGLFLSLSHLKMRVLQLPIHLPVPLSSVIVMVISITWQCLS